MSTEIVHINKLVAGGQGLGDLADGRKIFVWGGLPGETVEVKITSEKKSYAEGEVVRVVTASKNRVEPKEANYLDTSPWQITTIAAENAYKTAIVQELYERAHVSVPTLADAVCVGEDYGYRNNYMFRFCHDTNGELSLATVERSSNTLVPVEGSVLAMSEINTAAQQILAELQKLHIKPTTLRTLELRCNQAGTVVASLVIQQKHMPKLHLPSALQGLQVSYRGRNTKLEQLYTVGTLDLHDTLLGKNFGYDIDSFFQVNVPVYEKALQDMQSLGADSLVDMYAGVGTIGLSLAKKEVVLVESNAASAAWAAKNLATSGLKGDAVRARSERALAHIVSGKTVVFDPPRAGLDKAIIDRLLEVKPNQILYLSCDPATQARDVARLASDYTVSYMSVYNFFPHTPHIEVLVELTKQ